MASVLAKYEIAKTYLADALTETAGYENVTIAYGDVVGKITVPSAYIKLAERVTTEIAEPYYSDFTISMGIKALYQEESSFLPTLDPLIAAINSEGNTACGLEFMFVSGLEWGAENKEYSWATIYVKIQCYHD